jgi:peptide/nickel transport system substrate-binding protein
MRKVFVCILCGVLATAGTLFAAGQIDETPATTATAADTEVVLVGGRYTWTQNWLDAPTASQLGITQFSESPMLAAMVASGDLPPVDERLPNDPLVVAPYSEIGQYGGTLNVARMGPGDFGDMLRGRHGWLFRSDPSTSEVIPHLAKRVEASSDNMSLTIYLREGLKWSDGEPFTAEDIVFLYTYGFADPVVQDSWARGWTFDGELSEFVKIDDYTVRINFPSPVLPAIWKSHLNWYRSRHEMLFTAAHYMKQFHIDFNPDVEALAKEEGYENWVQLWDAAVETQPRQKYVQPEMGPWVMESRDSAGKHFVRNPYYFSVDTAGNQLPYIDRMEAEFFSDAEVAILSMMQGSIDIGGRLLTPGDFPLYKENETIGGYTVLEWMDTKPSRVTYAFNLTHEDPVKGPIFLDVRFRQAMSLAINREEINEFVFLGLGIPQQYTVHSGAEFYDPAWAEAFADYDPAESMGLLDEMNMTDRNGDGFREAPGGEEFVLLLTASTSSVLGAIGSGTTELVADYWREVGINVNYRVTSEDLDNELRLANQLDVVTWVAEHYMPSRQLVNRGFSRGGTGYAEPWDRWLAHGRWVAEGRVGDEPSLGVEPPAVWQTFMETVNNWVSATSDTEFSRIGREAWSQQAELLPVIGTVGYALRPIIITNKIHNVPETLPFAFETLVWMQTQPMQWFKTK